MVKSDSGDYAGKRRVDHVGAVKLSAHPGLQDNDTALLLCKPVKGEGGIEFKAGRRISHPPGRVEEDRNRLGEGRLADHFTVDAEALPDGLKVRRDAEARFIARAAKNLRQHGTGAALSVGSGHMDDAQALLRIAEPLHQLPDAAKAGRGLAPAARREKCFGPGICLVLHLLPDVPQERERAEGEDHILRACGGKRHAKARLRGARRGYMRVHRGHFLCQLLSGISAGAAGRFYRIDMLRGGRGQADHLPAVLIREHAENIKQFLPGEECTDRFHQGTGGVGVVGAVDQHQRLLADDLQPAGPYGTGKALTNSALRYVQAAPGKGKGSGSGKGRILDLVRPGETDEKIRKEPGRSRITEGKTLFFKARTDIGQIVRR